ncbi:hypothetical protein V5O48_019272, partial [Marasmius crinis-equi]
MDNPELGFGELISIDPTNIPSSSGPVDLTSRTIVCSGSEFQRLLVSLRASADAQNHGHLYHEEATQNFLKKPTFYEQRLTPNAELSTIHGRSIIPYASLQRYNGLKTEALTITWQFIHPPSRARSLKNVPTFHCVGYVAPYSITMAAAIIGPTPHFQRAIVIGIILYKKNWAYLAAQTEVQGKPVCLRVPKFALLPGLPYIHSKHLAFIALLCPALSGISPGDIGAHVQAMVDCYPPEPNCHEEEEMEVEPREGGPLWADRWTGMPSLRKPTDLGDWVSTHS